MPLDVVVGTQWGDEGKGHIVDLMAAEADLSPFAPTYEDLPGWEEDLRSALTWDDLPRAARAHLGRIETLTGAPIRLISVGPEREQIIRREARA
jgi:adenylosuccinate synthase